MTACSVSSHSNVSASSESPLLSALPDTGVRASRFIQGCLVLSSPVPSHGVPSPVVSSQIPQSLSSPLRFINHSGLSTTLCEAGEYISVSWHLLCLWRVRPRPVDTHFGVVAILPLSSFSSPFPSLSPSFGITCAKGLLGSDIVKGKGETVGLGRRSLETMIRN